MPTHVVVGASRGIGYAFLETLSKDPNNKVIGLVRTVEPTQKKVDADGLKNVTILHADLTKYTSLLEAAKKVSSISESVDFLWNNGAYLSELMVTKFLTDFDLSEHDKMVEDMQHSFTTNVVGVINAINAFLPLVKKSSIKKVITISTGMADNDLVSKYGIWESASYSSSKAALNNIICKYDAKFRPEGVLFLSLSPGMVDTGGKIPEDSELPRKFFAYTPNMVAPITPAQSVNYMLKIVDASTAAQDGGQFYSHLGKHQAWLNTA